MTVIVLIAAGGWGLAAALTAARVRLHRRLELMAEAVHELRGSAATIALAVAALRREPGGIRRMLAFEAELERMRAGLADLDEARSGTRAPNPRTVVPIDRLLRASAAGWRPAARASGRPLRLRWQGPPALVRADRRRLAQAISNLVANAVEHGSGPIELHGRRAGTRVVIEVRDGRAATGRADRPDHGRGLGIAGRAVGDAGGRVSLDRRPDGSTAAIELPVAER